MLKIYFYNINQMSVIAVQHPNGTQIVPSNKNDILCIKNPIPLQYAINRLGKDVSSIIGKCDDTPYLSEEKIIKKFHKQRYYDWIDLKIDVPSSAINVKMVIRFRNTLLSTVLFYNLVLESQGIEALEWTKRLNTDHAYAAAFQKTYNKFSGIKVMIQNKGKLEKLAELKDPGPITWKDMGVEIDIN